MSSTGSEILAFGSHFSANFQSILDCFISKFKMKYDGLENIKTDRVNTVVFNLLQIKQSKFFGTPGILRIWAIFAHQTLVKHALSYCTEHDIFPGIVSHPSLNS